MTVERAAKPSRPIAGTIGLLFGGLWSSLGAMSMPYALGILVSALSFLVTIALIVALWSERTRPGPGTSLFRRRGYIIAVALEVAAIYAATGLLTRNGLKSYLIQAVGVIIGLHFIGLWQATRLSRFLWIAGGMCCVSTLAAFLPDALGGFGPRNMVTGFGNALVLWIGSGRTWRAWGSNFQNSR